jgi:hypothetical protein
MISRRLAVGTTLAAAAGLAWQGEARARAITQRGIAGGGLAQFELSEAQFSLFASRLTLTEENEEVIVGSVIWLDPPSGFTFASTRITGYRDLEIPDAEGEARRIEGMMSVNDGDEYPFVLDVFAVGLPGSGLDSVVLTVGDGADTDAATPPAAGFGFSYAAAGPIVTGDVQILELDVETGPVVAPATPTA